MDDLDIFDNMNKPKINPLNYPNEKCNKCGCVIYKQAYIFKRIPGLEVGTGTDTVLYPIPVFVCNNCGELCEDDKNVLQEKDKEQTNNLIGI